MADEEPTDAEKDAWVEMWLERSRLYWIDVNRILAAQAMAEANPGCDVCAHVTETKARDVSEFLDQVERAGPLLGARVTVGGVWSFPTADVADHQAGHGGQPPFERLGPWGEEEPGSHA